MSKAKKVQSFRKLIAWWIGLVSHHLTFATIPDANLAQQNDFFGKNQSSILHIGIVGWAKGAKKTIQQHWAVGGEIAIGPLIEWHPLHGIGLQMGLLYSYNSFFTVDFSIDREKQFNPSILAFARGSVEALSKALSHSYQGYIVHLALANIPLHAISIPLFLRFYPEKSRRLVVYGGPRLIAIFSPIEKKTYCPIHVDTSMIKDVLYDSLMECKNLSDEGSLADAIPGIAHNALSKLHASILKVDSNHAQRELISKQRLNWDLVWNFGFAFKGKSGLVIGMHGLGFMLGYEFVK